MTLGMGIKVLCTFGFALSQGFHTACSASPKCRDKSLSLRQASAINTQGCAGFEAFTIANKTYIAAANFWDGRAGDMSADSAIFRFESSRRGAVTKPLQIFKTQGAHGWDHFRFGEDYHLLVVPNYYGCGGSKEEISRPKYADCRSTNIYAYNLSSDMEDVADAVFEKVGSLKTAGPSQTDHFFDSNGTAYIVVGENFADRVSVFKVVLNHSGFFQFTKLQYLTCPGAASMAIAELENGGFIMAVGSYYDQGWVTKSPVYMRPPTAELFGHTPVQYLDTVAPHDMEMFRYNGEVFLFVSQDRNEVTAEIQSSIFKLVNEEDNIHCASTTRHNERSKEADVTNDGISISRTLLSTNSNSSQRGCCEDESTGCQPKFELFQAIPTYGAHAAEFFTLPGNHASEGSPPRLFLAVANFGDRHAGLYTANSTLWTLINSSRNNDSKFEHLCDVPTVGATDWEYFQDDQGAHLIAVSNEGDIKNRQHQKSFIYSIEQESN